MDGDPDPWRRSRQEVLAQRDGGLDQRLAGAFEDIEGPAILIGADTPQTTAGSLGHAARALMRPGADAVLGAAEDGGYWAIGLRRPDRRALVGVPMSTAWTYHAQLERLRSLGLRVEVLPPMRDADRFADAVAVAREIPGTRFARLVAGWRDRGAQTWVRDLDLDRWLGPPTPQDEAVLARVEPPVLDVGCGPARFVLALAGRGVVSLGVDVAPAAVDVARRRGAPVLHRSVFERLPGEGRWGSALLLDGNIGIGGDPASLFRRMRQLLRAGGSALVEFDPAASGVRGGWARVRSGDRRSAPFPWATVGVDQAGPLAERSGFSLVDLWTEGPRAFAHYRSVETPATRARPSQRIDRVLAAVTAMGGAG
jgi:SAM-dependent methyltransferase